MYTTILMFIYRYMQTIGTHYVEFLSDLKLYLLFYCIFQLGTVSLIVVPLWNMVWPADRIKEAIRQVDPQIYTLIKDEPLVIGINVSI
jgi:hypothetical protein